MCTKLNCRKTYVDLFQGDTSQESTYLSRVSWGRFSNKLPWDPAAQLLRNREASLQSHLLAQHSLVWPQILLSKQILNILLSFLLIQMQKNSLINNANCPDKFLQSLQEIQLLVQNPPRVTYWCSKAAAVSPLPKILYYTTILTIISLILHYVQNQ